MTGVLTNSDVRPQRESQVKTHTGRRWPCDDRSRAQHDASVSEVKTRISSYHQKSGRGKRLSRVLEGAGPADNLISYF